MRCKRPPSFDERMFTQRTDRAVTGIRAKLLATNSFLHSHSKSAASVRELSASMRGSAPAVVDSSSILKSQSAPTRTSGAEESGIAASKSTLHKLWRAAETLAPSILVSKRKQHEKNVESTCEPTSNRVNKDEATCSGSKRHGDGEPRLSAGDDTTESPRAVGGGGNKQRPGPLRQRSRSLEHASWSMKAERGPRDFDSTARGEGNSVKSHVSLKSHFSSLKERMVDVRLRESGLHGKSISWELAPNHRSNQSKPAPCDSPPAQQRSLNSIRNNRLESDTGSDDMLSNISQVEMRHTWSHPNRRLLQREDLSRQSGQIDFEKNRRGPKKHTTASKLMSAIGSAREEDSDEVLRHLVRPSPPPSPPGSPPPSSSKYTIDSNSSGIRPPRLSPTAASDLEDHYKNGVHPAFLIDSGMTFRCFRISFFVQFSSPFHRMRSVSFA